MIHRLITTWNKTNLMKRIAIGIVLGVILALLFPKATGIGLLGESLLGGSVRSHLFWSLRSSQMLSPNTKKGQRQI